MTDRDGADRERDSIFRIRERTRWLDSALRDEYTLSRLDRDRTDGILGIGGGPSSSEAKRSAGPQNPLVLGEDLQHWPERGDGQEPRFTCIAALHSELVAINTAGQLCQWKWTEPEPFTSTEVSPSFLGKVSCSTEMESEIVQHSQISGLRHTSLSLQQVFVFFHVSPCDIFCSRNLLSYSLKPMKSSCKSLRARLSHISCVW